MIAVLVAMGCTGPNPPRTTLTVLAASSLTEAFNELAAGFEAAHPNVDVHLTFAGSQVLRLQVEQGARADLFASANPDHLQALVDTADVSATWTFAANELVVVTPVDAPTPSHFASLPEASRIVVGAPQVPIGAYTRELLRRASEVFGPALSDGVRRNVVSEEPNVRLVRAKVELGEADAAIVYRTDAVASPRVRTIRVPPTINVRAQYPIGVLSRSAHPDLGAAFVAYLQSPSGRAVLDRHGFVTGDPATLADRRP